MAREVSCVKRNALLEHAGFPVGGHTENSRYRDSTLVCGIHVLARDKNSWPRCLTCVFKASRH